MFHDFMMFINNKTVNQDCQQVIVILKPMSRSRFQVPLLIKFSLFAGCLHSTCWDTFITHPLLFQEGWVLFKLDDLHPDKDFKDADSNENSESLIKRYLKPNVSNASSISLATSEAGANKAWSYWAMDKWTMSKPTHPMQSTQ